VAIPDSFIEELRRDVRISEVMGRKFRLRRKGSEHVCIDNESLKGNDTKGVWKDHGTSDPGGDIFRFLMVYDGKTFIEAVKEVAAIAGRTVPSDGSPGNGSREHAQTHRNGARNGEAADRDTSSGRTSFGTRQVVGSWSYTDERGRELYQTVRVQWKMQDGSWKKDPKTGKPEKTFLQRRRSPDVDNTWVNGLKFVDEEGYPIEYMRKNPSADWQRYDSKKYQEWNFTERRDFSQFGNIDHTLLNLPDITDALREERHEQRTIFIPEGEKKVDQLVSWGFLATCNSGGAGNWHRGMAELLRDAADIVLLEDNDDAGRKRTAKIAPMLLEHGCRVRVLSMPDIWPECPPKGDIVDWAQVGGGDKNALIRALRQLPDWTPPPYQSTYGALQWGAQREFQANPYEWQIKGLMPSKQAILIIGPSGSGKSFLATSMSLAVARGVKFNDRKVQKAGVVYLNYEASGGMMKRTRAYQQFYGLPDSERIPFVWLTRPPGLYASEENATALAHEIKEVSKDWDVPVGVIVIDTHNAATRGSSEIKTEDVTKIMDRYAKVQQETGAAIWIVGHTNQNGEHRGSEVLYNGIETCLLIDRVKEGYGKRAEFVKDDRGRAIRRATVKKQREGIDGESWDFILQTVELGLDEDNAPITSMVPIRLTDETRRKRTRRPLTQEEIKFSRVLTRTLDAWPKPVPPGLEVARSITTVTTWEHFQEIYNSEYLTVDKTETEQIKERGLRMRAGNSLKNLGIIGSRKIGDTMYLWRVKDEDAPSSQRTYDYQQPIIDQATGQPIESL
jgi:energy-coupling factor transporter ATP-binding protein EcfA2